MPLRPLANALGIEDKYIGYKDGVITLKKGEIKVRLEIGQKTMKIGEALKEIDVAPEIIKGSSFLPAKYVAEAFGYIVKWKDGKVIITEPVNMVLSKSIPDPVPVLTEGKDKYYDLEEMLILGGLTKDDFFFEKEDIIILNNNKTYNGLVLTDKANKIYLVDKEGEYFKYDLENQLTLKEGKWLVKNDDVLRVGMLGTILGK